MTCLEGTVAFAKCNQIERHSIHFAVATAKIYATQILPAFPIRVTADSNSIFEEKWCFDPYVH